MLHYPVGLQLLKAPKTNTRLVILRTNFQEACLLCRASRGEPNPATGPHLCGSTLRPRWRVHLGDWDSACGAPRDFCQAQRGVGMWAVLHCSEGSKLLGIHHEHQVIPPVRGQARSHLCMGELPTDLRLSFELQGLVELDTHCTLHC